MRNQETVYLVDGTSICYRSFFAINLSTSKGFPSGAVYGFYKTLQKLISKYNPVFLGICFDVSRRTFRQEKFEAYKIQRPPLPQGLSPQIPVIKKMLNSLGIKIVEKQGFEADDVIAALTDEAVNNNKRVVIVTMDKDMYQLIENDKVVVFNPNYDRLLTENDFFKEYEFAPINMVDFLSLAGDSSDNIPGAKGIGKVGAAKLIKEFKNIEGIFANLDKLTPKMKDILEKNKDNIMLSKDLVILRRCELGVGWQDLKIKEADVSALYSLFSELEFKSFLKDFSAPSLNLNLEVKNKDSLDFLRERQDECFSFIGDEAAVYVFDKKDNCLYQSGRPGAVSFLADGRVKKVCYDFKNQMFILGNIAGVYFDVKVAAYLIDCAFADYELSSLIYYYLGKPVADVSVYNKVYFISMLYEKFSQRLKEDGLEALFLNVEMPLVDVLFNMEKWGVNMDIGVLENLLARVEKLLASVSKDIFSLAGGEFNLNSPKQLRKVLFEDLKIPPVSKTKTGYSTGVDVLKKLSQKFPIARLLLDYRELNKLSSTYILPLIEEGKLKGGRLHAHFNQTSTQTGRLSSSSPNLQSIPAKGEFALDLRKSFIPSFEKGVFLSADYSQIELRLLAHFSGDEKLIEAFIKNADIHAFTASLLFNQPQKEVSEEHRDLAKKINFAILYGMSSYGVSRELEIALPQAEVFIQEYFLRYPRVRAFIDGVYAEVEKSGFVKTILGRRRYLADFNSSNMQLRDFARRQAVNTPIQGSCADLIKKAMVEISREFYRRALKAKFLIQIHDELIFDLPEDEMKAVVVIVREIMENTLKLSVPLKVNLKAGKNWAEMKEI